jgi:DivIVA domain-containing protein
MLSLDEVKNISFRRANFGGYKPEDVDDFIDEVQNSYEKLLNERESFAKRIEQLNEKVKTYELQSSSIEKVIENAQNTAETALNEAAAESEKLINTAKEEAESQKTITEKLRIEAIRMKEELKGIYKKYLENIENMPVEEEHPEKHLFGTGNFELEYISGGKSENKPSLSDDVFAGKVEPLEFGENYKPEEKKQPSSGVYGGILKKL